MGSLKKYSEVTGSEIAIIGMACNVPGAKNKDEFWENLKAGKECIDFFSEQELNTIGISELTKKNPAFVPVKGGIIYNKASFDHKFFSFTPNEANLLDPQIRLFMQCVWEAIEDSGYSTSKYSGRIGLFGAAKDNFHWEAQSFMEVMKDNPEMIPLLKNLNNKDFMVSLTSYKLNLKGPAINITTACSSSLTAVDIACRSLLTDGCDMALAGGIRILFNNKGYIFKDGLVVSPDGHCRAFDENSKGTVPGEGVGIVMLKKLDRAILDRDNIYAVIKGIGINNDGARKATYNAPSAEGQSIAIKHAYKMANISPELLTLVEAHGTGTVLGDPIEIDGLRKAFNTEKKGFCAIGSVKTNIGHLDVASGVIGLIKVTLALKNGYIPPSLNYNEPNPKLNIENSPFYVINRLKKWEDNFNSLKAGVSSFGIGGTNIHVVLEEAPFQNRKAIEEKSRLLVISAKDQDGLKGYRDKLYHFIHNNPEINLSNLSYTINSSRSQWTERLALVYTDRKDLLDKIEDKNWESIFKGNSGVDKKETVFMFPGQGSQYYRMGYELYSFEPVFRESLDECFNILHELKEINYQECLFTCNDPSLINNTLYTQPILFSFEYSLARTLISIGIVPDLLIGHSLGEYVAATLSGVFSLKDALFIVCERGKLMENTLEGAMINILCPSSEIEKYIFDLNGKVSIAAENNPDTCVLSGNVNDISIVCERLKNGNVPFVKLKNNRAYHSVSLNCIADEFEEVLDKIVIHPSKTPFISNLTGKIIQKGHKIDKEYWIKHLIGSIKFWKGFEDNIIQKDMILLEVGPGNQLSTLVRKYLPNNVKSFNILSNSYSEGEEHSFFLEQIGKSWVSGLDIDWESLYKNKDLTKISLPTYPFKESKFNTEIKIDQNNVRIGNSSNSKKGNNGLFYTPFWRQIRSTEDVANKVTIAFIDDSDLAKKIIANDNDGKDCFFVFSGERYQENPDKTFTINPAMENDYKTLFERISNFSDPVGRIIYSWNLFNNSKIKELPNYEDNFQTNYFSLLNIARNLNILQSDQQLDIKVLCKNIFCVIGDEGERFADSILLGPVLVIPKEYPNVKCQLIDVLYSEVEQQGKSFFLLKKELNTEIRYHLVSIRGNNRWIREYDNFIEIDKSNDTITSVKRGGTYVITGGIGGIGIEIAKRMAQIESINIILISRSIFPEKSSWSNIDKEKVSKRIKRKIKDILRIEELGSYLEIIQGDISDEIFVINTFKDIYERFNKVDGIFHAAGIVDGGLIQTKSNEQSLDVFKAKISGTLNICKIIHDYNPEKIILFSSITSITGAFGQVAYTAANNFLDALSDYYSSKYSIDISSVNWNTWSEVGMAVDNVDQFQVKKKLKNSIFTEYFEVDKKRFYLKYLDYENDWILNEHSTGDFGVIPGVYYFELVLKAIEQKTGRNKITIKTIYFTKPLIVNKNQVEEIHITIKEKDANCFEFEVINADNENEAIYCKGEANLVDHEKTKMQNLQILMGEMDKEYSEDDLKLKEGLLKYGNRWNIKKWMKCSDKFEYSFIQLPDSYKEDLNYFDLHPAIMDIAGMFQSFDIPNRHELIPFSYKDVKIYSTIPHSCYSMISLDKSSLEQDEIKLSISIMDLEGTLIVEIGEFSMIRSKSKGTKSISIEKNEKKKESEIKDYLLSNGITSKEGTDIFIQLLKTRYNQIVVSKNDLFKSLSKINESFSVKNFDKLITVEESEEAGDNSSLDAKLKNIWKSILGTEIIQDNDNFFEEGGDSLSATILISKINKTLRLNLSVTVVFKYPTVKELANYISNCNKEKQEPIKKVGEKPYYKLSFAQKRLYFNYKLWPENISYNLPQLIRINNSISIEKIESLIKALISVNEVFRTAITEINGEPVQLIMDNVTFEIKTVNCKATELEKTIRETIKPFDLSKPPFLRATLCKTDTDNYLLFDIHHIITDAYSQPIIEDQVNKLFVGDELNIGTLNYKDYAEWQNSESYSLKLQKQKSYWIEEFKEGVKHLNLPFSEGCNSGVFEGDFTEFTLTNQDVKVIYDFIKEKDLTLFMFILAVINVTLSKVCNQQEITVGVPVAGRNHPDLEKMIGLFTNTLLIKNIILQDNPIAEILSKVKEKSLKAFDNQEYPIEFLLDDVKYDPSKFRTPLINVLFNMHNLEEKQLPESKNLYNTYKLKQIVHNIELQFICLKYKDGIKCLIEYDKRMFDEESIQDIKNYFLKVIQGFIDSPSQCIKDLKLLREINKVEVVVPEGDFDFGI